jgi:hypothetical protein
VFTSQSYLSGENRTNPLKVLFASLAKVKPGSELLEKFLMRNLSFLLQTSGVTSENL